MPLTWTGFDGVEWDMTDRASGVLIMAGARGFGMAPHTHWRSKSPAVPGARWLGAVGDEREVFWPIKVWHDGGSREWVERDRAFWATLDPQKTGTWTITHPDGQRRHLTLRLADDGDPSFDTLPALMGWARYGIKLTADDPFWAGDVIRRSWAAGSSSDFFNGSSKAPSFHISSANALATATLTNPGDVDAYLTWTAHGPFTSVTVGVDGSTVVAPVTAAAGDTLVIDTNPEVQAAFLNGVDVTAQLTSSDFVPLPPGEDVSLSLALAGTGYIETAFTPRYYRAW
jgi:hypothetical protein